MKKLLISIAIVSGVGTPAMASEPALMFNNGNMLLADCTGSTSGVSQCIGYLKGVADALRSLGLADGLRTVNVPVGVTGGQLKDIVVQYIQEHPEMRHVAAAQLVYIALGRAFRE